MARGVTVRRSARGSRRLSSHSTVLQLVQVFQKIDGLLQSIAFLIEYERQILPALSEYAVQGCWRMMFGRRISLRLKAQRHRSIAGDVEFAHTPDPANGGSWRDAPQMERAERVCVDSLAGVLCQLDPNELPGLL